VLNVHTLSHSQSPVVIAELGQELATVACSLCVCAYHDSCCNADRQCSWSAVTCASSCCIACTIIELAGHWCHGLVAQFEATGLGGRIAARRIISGAGAPSEELLLPARTPECNLQCMVLSCIHRLGTLPPDKRLVLQACGDSQAIMAGTCSGIDQAFTCLNRVFQAHL